MGLMGSLPIRPIHPIKKLTHKKNYDTLNFPPH